jgi:hypothetical protein
MASWILAADLQYEERQFIGMLPKPQHEGCLAGWII